MGVTLSRTLAGTTDGEVWPRASIGLGAVFRRVFWLYLDLLVAVSMIFSWYVADFSSYNRIYRSLGAVVGFMTWIWLSVVIVLIGAELDTAIEKRKTRESARRVVRHQPI